MNEWMTAGGRNSHALVQLSSSLRSLQSTTPSHTDDLGRHTLLGHTWWHLAPGNKTYTFKTSNCIITHGEAGLSRGRPLTTGALLTAVTAAALNRARPAARRPTLALPTIHFTGPAGCCRLSTEMWKWCEWNTKHSASTCLPPRPSSQDSFSKGLAAFGLVPSVRTVLFAVANPFQRHAASVPAAELSGAGCNTIEGTSTSRFKVLPAQQAGMWRPRGSLTALWREDAVEQVETPVSQRFIRVEVERERWGVDPLPAAVRHRVAQPSKVGRKRHLTVIVQRRATFWLVQSWTDGWLAGWSLFNH